MFDQSPRPPLPSTGATPITVGPNTYVICDSGHKKKNVAPFLSTAERKCGAENVYSDAIENIQIERSHVGGSSPRNKDQRFKHKESDTPGPADYSLKPSCKKCPYVGPPRYNKGRLYLCKVPHTLKGNGPSIPSHHDQNGYDIDDENNLIKNPPDCYDTTLGPAFYSLPRGETCWTKKRYHSGCRWSLSKSRRSSFNADDTPAPNAYDINIKFCQCKEEDVRAREMARFFGFYPRFIEELQLRQSHENNPGPASYNIASTLRQGPSLSVTPVPMISGAERFKSISSNTPAPGDYNICDCIMKQQHFNYAFPSFLNTAERETGEKVDFDKPDPTTYNIPSPIITKVRKMKNIYSWAAFTSMAERKTGSVGEDAACMPAPNQYEVASGNRDKKEAVTNSPFKSTTIRLKSIEKTDDPGAASYSITAPFNRLKGKCQHHRSNVGFLCSAERGVVRRIKAPGPADYVIEPDLGLKGMAFGSNPRFKRQTHEGPGPGSYSLHMSGDCFAKAYLTHNMYLRNNVARTKIQHPRETYPMWRNTIVKKKKLVWFTQRPDSA